MDDAPVIDIAEAEHFLAMVAEDAPVTFQTFDDVKPRLAENKAKLGFDPYAKILHGDFQDQVQELIRQNTEKAGIFFTVNQTDTMGRGTKNITGIRALFIDLDGAPLPTEWELSPHIIVESSPGRFHVYWLMKDCSLAQFAPVQKALAAKYGGDPSVFDLPRVMRLPGFLHSKNGLFQSKILSEQWALPYSLDEIVSALHLEIKEEPIAAKPDLGNREQNLALKRLEEKGWLLGEVPGHPGKWRIVCPWWYMHTDGDKEAAYFEPHTNGYSGHGFKCLHAHCGGRTNEDFIEALSPPADTTQGTTWADLEPKPQEIPSNEPDGIGDSTLPWEIPQQLINSSPGILRAYIDWFLSCARYPEPVYAFSSAVAFVTAAVATRRYLYDAYLNTGIFTIGPTQSGKESIKRFLHAALIGMRTPNDPDLAVIKGIENDFASGSAAWWVVHDHGPTILFHTELGKLLAAGNRPGTMIHEVLTAIMRLHDDVMYTQVMPTRYSERVKKNVRVMSPIDNPFLSVHGLSTPRFYREARSMAGEDGSLNRLLILNCEGTAEERESERITPLPDEIIRFFGRFHRGTREIFYAGGVEAYRKERSRAVLDKMRRAPGTWGRFGLKSSRLALLASICREDATTCTREDMSWACDVMEFASEIATRKFEQYGGLADSVTNALEKAIMAMFDAPAVRRNKGILTRSILYPYCRMWRESDVLLRERVLAHMEKGAFLIAAGHGWKKGNW